MSTTTKPEVLNRVTFDKGSRKFVLKAFGLSVNAQKIIVDTKTKLPVVALDGQPVKEKEFAGLVPSYDRNEPRRLVRNTLPGIVDLVEYVEKHHRN